MRAVIYRPKNLHGSWRPKSLVDLRGPRFPQEYQDIFDLEVESVDLPRRFDRLLAEDIAGLFDRYSPETGDIVFLSEGEDLAAYACAPFGWERVKFGREWRSPS